MKNIEKLSRKKESYLKEISGNFTNKKGNFVNQLWKHLRRTRVSRQNKPQSESNFQTEKLSKKLKNPPYIHVKDRKIS
jgi:hypothetical protein